MRKIRTAMGLLAAAVVVLSGCGARESAKMTTVEETAASYAKPQENGLRVVCTSFPQYDFVNQILGDNPAGAEVIYLLGSGVDMHNYQASAEDMIKIRTSDLFLYVGGESDQWVEPIVKQSAGAPMRALALVDMVTVKEELIVEGMEHEDDHGDGDHDVEEGDVHKEELDEHVWLSLKNALVIVNRITEELCAMDPANADVYQANSAAYTEKLKDLDGRYADMVEGSARNTILVADRFPFRYLADDYRLEYFAAFPGCSAETEASFETVIFLAGKVSEKELPVVLTIDGSDGKIAKTVVDNSTDKKADVKTLNSIQSVSADDINAGASYLSFMEENLSILKEALN